jgi:hypothetical protein
MGLSGKYNFPGIKKLGAANLRGVLALSPYTAWMLKGGRITDILLEVASNWLANKGLILFNVGAIIIDGELDQSGFDSAMDNAIQEISNKGGRDKLTAAEIKAIDDEVIKAARKFIVIGKPRP